MNTQWREGTEMCKCKLTKRITTPLYMGYWLHLEVYENCKISFNYHSFKLETVNELKKCLVNSFVKRNFAAEVGFMLQILRQESIFTVKCNYS